MASGDLSKNTIDSGQAHHESLERICCKDKARGVHKAKTLSSHLSGRMAHYSKSIQRASAIP